MRPSAIKIILALVVVLSLCSRPCFSGEVPARALFVSLVQDPAVLSSRERIVDLLMFAQESHIEVLFVQIYRSNQAWFPSKTADDSLYRENLKLLSQDTFAFLIEEAHRRKIEVHAWLNLMSLSVNTQAPMLRKYGTDILTRNTKAKTSIEDFKIDGQYFLEPGDPRVRGDLKKIAKEILKAYPALDGIQFDYIRYPDVEPHYGYTPVNIERFKKTTGATTADENDPRWQDWRRRQVTELLEGLVRTVRSMRPRIKVSTTGCMPYARAYYEAYQDWPGWLSNRLVDFVTVMDYSKDPAEFERWIRGLKDHVTDFSRLVISIGAYKMVDAPQIFETEFSRCEAMGQGCAVFHYGSVVESPEIKKFLSNR